MIAFYALGGGFGHLTRIRTFINQIGIDIPLKIITTNKFAYTKFESDDIILIELKDPSSREELGLNIQQVFCDYNFSECYLDTFPGGILSELKQEYFKEVKLNLICRRLKWNSYFSHHLNSLEYNKLYILEELENPHFRYISERAKDIVSYSLDYPEKIVSTSVKGEFWLIIHSSNKQELNNLIDYAFNLAKHHNSNPTFIVCSDQIPDKKNVKRISDPSSYLDGADKIFSGAGFNTWYQLRPYRNKHISIPFQRRFDDQFWRSQQP